MKRLIIPLIVVIGLAGCTSTNNGPSGLHKVAWYASHPAALKKEVSWCNNDVPRQKLAACLNAYEADSNAATKAFFASPPGGFTGGGATVGKGGWTP